MDAIEAFRTQTEYFKSNGFSRAEKISAKKYLDIAIGHYDKIKKDKQYSKETHKLKKEIRAHLNRYKDVFFDIGDGYYYYMFYPFEMKTRGYFRAFIKKVFKKKNRK